MKKSYSMLLMMLCLALCNEVHSRARDGGIKVLVLLIASDDLPVYGELQKIWRSYMHNDPGHVEAYFMKADPNLSQEVVVDGDVIWIRSVENLIPGLINKTVKSLKFLSPRFNEFDFILRANLSSFYVFPKLLQFLETLPTKRVYCASSIMGYSPLIGSGCGFIISPDVASLLIKHEASMVDNCSDYDDILVGHFMYAEKIKLIPHYRMDFYSLDDWNRMNKSVPSGVFHFRIKTDNHLRITNDILIQKELLKRYYNIDQ